MASRNEMAARNGFGMRFIFAPSCGGEIAAKGSAAR